MPVAQEGQKRVLGPQNLSHPWLSYSATEPSFRPLVYCSVMCVVRVSDSRGSWTTGHVCIGVGSRVPGWDPGPCKWRQEAGQQAAIASFPLTMAGVTAAIENFITESGGASGTLSPWELTRVLC